MQEPQRLSTGSLVREVEAVGERLHYQLVEGTGPSAGWVSFHAGGKELVSRTKLARTAGAASGGQTPQSADSMALELLPPTGEVRPTNDLSSLPVKELKKQLTELGIDYSSCTEKRDFVKLLVKADADLVNSVVASSAKDTGSEWHDQAEKASANRSSPQGPLIS